MIRRTRENQREDSCSPNLIERHEMVMRLTSEGPLVASHSSSRKMKSTFGLPRPLAPPMYSSSSQSIRLLLPADSALL